MPFDRAACVTQPSRMPAPLDFDVSGAQSSRITYLVRFRRLRNAIISNARAARLRRRSFDRPPLPHLTRCANFKDDRLGVSHSLRVSPACARQSPPCLVSSFNTYRISHRSRVRHKISRARHCSIIVAATSPYRTHSRKRGVLIRAGRNEFRFKVCDVGGGETMRGSRRSRRARRVLGSGL